MASARTRGMAGWHVMLAVASGACNQVYGLEATSLPPPDAPFACPAIGETPSFSQIEQHLAQACQGYAIAAASPFASAMCSVESSKLSVHVAGSRDAMLVPAAGTPTSTFDVQTQIAIQYDRVWPSPDGMRVFVRRHEIDLAPSLPTIATTLVEYQRGGDGVFVAGATVPFIGEVTDDLGTLALVGGDELAIVARQSTARWEEYRRVQGVWVPAVMTTNAALGVDLAGSISLSADGLRALFTGRRTPASATEVFYTDRSHVDEPFGPARAVSGLPPRLSSVLMTPDCADAHLPGLQSIFRAVRIR